jgi:hypothetical protein
VPGNAVASFPKLVRLGDYGVTRVPGSSGATAANAQGYSPHRTVKVEIEITIPATGFAYVNQHLDDGLKGPQVDLNGDGIVDTLRYAKGAGAQALWPTSSGPLVGVVLIPELAAHTFKVGAGWGSVTPLGEDSVLNDNEFKKNPGVSGRVTIGPTEFGTPVVGHIVELWLGGSKLADAKTDEDGFYLITHKHTGRETTYEVRTTAPPATTGDTSQLVALKANGIAVANFEFFNP